MPEAVAYENDVPAGRGFKLSANGNAGFGVSDPDYMPRCEGLERGKGCRCGEGENAVPEEEVGEADADDPRGDRGRHAAEPRDSD